MKILLINPNTSEETTRMMVSIAGKYAPAHWHITGITLSNSAAVINTPELLEDARQEILMRAAEREFEGFDAVIVAAFGDPGLDALRSSLAVPVVGIGESAIQAATAQGRPFAVVSITPQLSRSTAEQVVREGGRSLFAGIYYTADNPIPHTPGVRPLSEDIAIAANRALSGGNVSTLIIAGGPLASIADNLVLDVDCHIVQPLPCAIEKLQGLLQPGM
ncbi:aspartate/glutamate racemase family protein [Pseudomonas sp. NBRC 111131]|uniref:aspartate/glutamate racemase family protein n=1 Tax=Pseudomonas sp. NBRC 111131 TaxID=1661046 RepID=UPI0006D4463A|nr:aspartate/glutamate racemase family protein [Pseudomonas sp. NBRC 111131]